MQYLIAGNLFQWWLETGDHKHRYTSYNWRDLVKNMSNACLNYAIAYFSGVEVVPSELDSASSPADKRQLKAAKRFDRVCRKTQTCKHLLLTAEGIHGSVNAFVWSLSKTTSRHQSSYQESSGKNWVILRWSATHVSTHWGCSASRWLVMYV